MKLFLKTLGFGALYIVLSPAIAALLVFYFVYCVGIFLYQAIRNTIVFFSGGTVGGDLAPDVEAKKILLQRQRDKLEESAQPAQPTQQNIYVFNGNIPPNGFPQPQNLNMSKPQLNQETPFGIEEQKPKQIAEQQNNDNVIIEQEETKKSEQSFDDALMQALGIKAKRPDISNNDEEQKSHSMPQFNEDDFDDITVSSEEGEDD